MNEVKIEINNASCLSVPRKVNTKCECASKMATMLFSTQVVHATLSQAHYGLHGFLSVMPSEGLETRKPTDEHKTNLFCKNHIRTNKTVDKANCCCRGKVPRNV